MGTLVGSSRFHPYIKIITIVAVFRPFCILIQQYYYYHYYYCMDVLLPLTRRRSVVNIFNLARAGVRPPPGQQLIRHRAVASAADVPAARELVNSLRFARRRRCGCLWCLNDVHTGDVSAEQETYTFIFYLYHHVYNISAALKWNTVTTIRAAILQFIPFYGIYFFSTNPLTGYRIFMDKFQNKYTRYDQKCMNTKISTL